MPEITPHKKTTGEKVKYFLMRHLIILSGVAALTIGYAKFKLPLWVVFRAGWEL